MLKKMKERQESYHWESLTKNEPIRVLKIWLCTIFFSENRSFFAIILN